jgi:hypothetical protein
MLALGWDIIQDTYMWLLFVAGLPYNKVANFQG